MIVRGKYKFEIGKLGNIFVSDNNLKKLRNLFLDRSEIFGELLGPGDPGDFDLGSWHILCHLTAASAVFKKFDKYLLVEISHAPLLDEYIATVTVDSENESVVTFPLFSETGKKLIEGSKLIGFFEGTSFGHISARDIKDNPEDFNNNFRQEYDNDVTSGKEGGRVWEHWVVTRDISENSQVGNSILRAYLEMLSICGGAFAGIIGRGRTDYFHPEQLKSIINSGLITDEEALLEITPKSIPTEAHIQIATANPKICLDTVKFFPWETQNISYFMFERKIKNWNTSDNFKKIINNLSLTISK